MNIAHGPTVHFQESDQSRGTRSRRPISKLQHVIIVTTVTGMAANSQASGPTIQSRILLSSISGSDGRRCNDPAGADISQVKMLQAAIPALRHDMSDRRCFVHLRKDNACCHMICDTMLVTQLLWRLGTLADTLYEIFLVKSSIRKQSNHSPLCTFSIVLGTSHVHFVILGAIATPLETNPNGLASTLIGRTRLTSLKRLYNISKFYQYHGEY